MDVDIAESYANSTKRLLLLDYDGTLAELKPTPPEAKPTPELLNLLKGLANNRHNTVVVVSGRDHHTLGEWLGTLPISLAAEHGLLYKEPGQAWQLTSHIDTSWKPAVRAAMDRQTAKIEGAITEEKSNALVWHWRAAKDQQKAIKAADQLVSELSRTVDKSRLRIMLGADIIEVQPHGINKGLTAKHWLGRASWDFVLAAGDDTTDEDLFGAMPDSALTVKIGPGNTVARLRLESPAALHRLLQSLTAM